MEKICREVWQRKIYWQEKTDHNNTASITANLNEVIACGKSCQRQEFSLIFPTFDQRNNYVDESHNRRNMTCNHITKLRTSSAYI